MSYFEILGLGAALEIDAEWLHKRFLELSANIHPDRFVTSESREQSFSLRWSTAINRSYQTIRDISKRSWYLLELLKVEIPKSPPVPISLAERYFELQDLLTESNDKSSLKSFESEIRSLIELNQKDWEKIARLWSSDSSAPKLLLANLIERKYLESMLRNLTE